MSIATKLGLKAPTTKDIYDQADKAKNLAADAERRCYEAHIAGDNLWHSDQPVAEAWAARAQDARIKGEPEPPEAALAISKLAEHKREADRKARDWARSKELRVEADGREQIAFANMVLEDHKNDLNLYVLALTAPDSSESPNVIAKRLIERAARNPRIISYNDLSPILVYHAQGGLFDNLLTVVQSYLAAA